MRWKEDLPARPFCTCGGQTTLTEAEEEEPSHFYQVCFVEIEMYIETQTNAHYCIQEQTKIPSRIDPPDGFIHHQDCCQINYVGET